MQTTARKKRKESKVIAFRLDGATAADVENLANRLKSSKSHILKMGVARVLDEAAAGYIRIPDAIKRESIKK